MLYGDSPVKLNEHEDALGLNRYTLLPNIFAVRQSGNLYAYCMANPVGFLDRSGQLAWPGEIHNAVLNRVAAEYGFYKEQQINYEFGWGRADLISSTGEVWDVKRDRPSQVIAGVAQVEKYVRNTWKNNPTTQLRVGGAIEGGSFVHQSGLTTYYVTYRYAGNGIIAYDYYAVTDWKTIGEIALGAAIVAGIACVIVYTGGAAAPSLVFLV